MNIYEFMNNLKIEDESAGIDALTITAMGLGGKLTIGFIMDKFSESFAVEEEKKFVFQGASGFQRGPYRYAAKWNEKHQQQWSILMVTGPESGLTFSEAINYDCGDLKYTRIDICIDVKLSEIVTNLAHRLYLANVKRVSSEYHSSLTGETVYFGKRNAPSFIRIYDKSLEFGESLGSVWRFELEAKKELAHSIALDIAAYKAIEKPVLSEVEYFSSFVFGEMKRLGIPTPKPGDFPNVRRCKITLSSNEMKLNWLRERVNRTVRGLMAAGYEKEVGEALGLQSYLPGFNLEEN